MERKDRQPHPSLTDDLGRVRLSKVLLPFIVLSALAAIVYRRQGLDISLPGPDKRIPVPIVTANLDGCDLQIHWEEEGVVHPTDDHGHRIGLTPGGQNLLHQLLGLTYIVGVYPPGDEIIVNETNYDIGHLITHGAGLLSETGDQTVKAWVEPANEEGDRVSRRGYSNPVKITHQLKQDCRATTPPPRSLRPKSWPPTISTNVIYRHR